MCREGIILANPAADLNLPRKQGKRGNGNSNEWLAKRLEMGHSRAMSRLIRHGRETPEILKLSQKLEKMLRCAD